MFNGEIYGVEKSYSVWLCCLYGRAEVGFLQPSWKWHSFVCNLEPLQIPIWRCLLPNKHLSNFMMLSPWVEFRHVVLSVYLPVQGSCTNTFNIPHSKTTKTVSPPPPVLPSLHYLSEIQTIPSTVSTLLVTIPHKSSSHRPFCYHVPSSDLNKCPHQILFLSSDGTISLLLSLITQVQTWTSIHCLPSSFTYQVLMISPSCGMHPAQCIVLTAQCLLYPVSRWLLTWN